MVEAVEWLSDQMANQLFFFFCLYVEMYVYSMSITALIMKKHFHSCPIVSISRLSF